MIHMLMLMNSRCPSRPSVTHFFASNAASYITGQTIGVNGGPSLGGIPDA